MCQIYKIHSKTSNYYMLRHRRLFCGIMSKIFCYIYLQNGAEYEYKYDKNGNIVSVKKVKGKTTEKPDTTEETSKWNQKELRQINRFRRKRPVIKSLSAHKKDGKVYMNIQIRQMLPLQEEGENGYQMGCMLHTPIMKMDRRNQLAVVPD